METEIIHSDEPVTLLGAAEPVAPALARALELAPRLVAADGGANVALAAGLMPEAVIGDLDSLGDAARAALPPDRILEVPEQISTDFEKCLTRIAAPLVIGVGFTGGRLDHLLAALAVLTRYPARRCLLLGPDEIVFLAPPRIAIELPRGTRVSLFPLAEVRGRSLGLRWPIDGLVLAPDGRLGTSNEALGPVEFTADRPSLLAILPASALRAAVAALAGSERWP